MVPETLSGDMKICRQKAEPVIVNIGSTVTIWQFGATRSTRPNHLLCNFVGGRKCFIDFQQFLLRPILAHVTRLPYAQRTLSETLTKRQGRHREHGNPN